MVRRLSPHPPGTYTTALTVRGSVGRVCRAHTCYVHSRHIQRSKRPGDSCAPGQAADGSSSAPAWLHHHPSRRRRRATAKGLKGDGSTSWRSSIAFSTWRGRFPGFSGRPVFVAPPAGCARCPQCFTRHVAGRSLDASAFRQRSAPGSSATHGLESSDPGFASRIRAELATCPCPRTAAAAALPGASWCPPRTATS